MELDSISSNHLESCGLEDVFPSSANDSLIIFRILVGVGSPSDDK